MSIIVTQSLSQEFVSNVCLKSTNHIRNGFWRVPCLAVFWHSVFGLLSPSMSESHLFICNFCFGLRSYPLQYDPKKDLACMRNKSNCSVIGTLFKITFLESGMSVKNVHFSGHLQFYRLPEILCILFSIVSPPVILL